MLGDHPVRGHPVPVQQSRLREQQGSGADRDQPLGVRGVYPQPVDECRIRSTGALAAGDEEGVGRFRVGEAAVRYERESDARADRCAVQ